MKVSKNMTIKVEEKTLLELETLRVKIDAKIKKYKRRAFDNIFYAALIEFAAKNITETELCKTLSGK